MCALLAGVHTKKKNSITNNIIKDMKKAYIAPEVTELTVVTESMVATSLSINNGTVNTTGAGVQLGKEQRGEWGNLPLPLPEGRRSELRSPYGLRRGRFAEKRHPS